MFEPNLRSYCFKVINLLPKHLYCKILFMKKILQSFAICSLVIIVGCNTSDKKGEIFAEKEETEESEDGMERWMEQNEMMTKDPALGYVPYERLATAQNYTKSLMSNATLRTNALAWNERGPNNIGGRTRALIIDRRDATGNTLFAGSVGGGLWKCTNFKGTNFSWTVINDQLANLAISALAQDPSNLNTMYAGTGEGWFNGGAIRGVGIYKSTDGGVSWNLLASTDNAGSNSDFDFIQDLAITSTGIVFATTRSRFCNRGGIFRSSDGGTTWTRVVGNSGSDCTTPRDLRAADLEIAANGDIYVSSGLQGDADATRGKLYKSLASNGANIGTAGTWTDITPPGVTGSATYRRIEVAIASNNTTIYALCQKVATTSIGAIMKSTDGGATWVQMTTPSWCDQGTTRTDFTRDQCWYDLIVAVDPNDANTAIIGGVDVLKTTDGGTTWSQITQWNAGCGSLPRIHADIHSLMYYNGSSSEIIATTDGGVHYSSNSGTAWTDKNTNYNVTQYYACDMHPTNANYFLAGAQDNGTQRFTQVGVNTTTTATGGDGGVCHIDQTDGQIQITAFTNNQYRFSRNGGTSFGSISGGSGTTGFFINPTEYDDTLDVLYTSVSTNNYGLVTGFSGSGTPTYQVVPFTDLGGKQVTTFKVDPNVSAGGTVWMVGSGSGTPVFLKVSSANTTSPVVVASISPSGFTSGSYIGSIDVEQGNPNHLLATVTNYGANSVLESVDGGNNWANIEGNLPDMPVRWGIFGPSNGLLTNTAVGGGIILATETGVWAQSGASAGIATAWVPQNTGLATVTCYMLKYRPSDRTLSVATHGRGLYTTIIPSTPTSVNTVQNTKGFITYISANTSTLFLKTGNLNGVKNIQVSIVDMQGRIVKSDKTNYSNQSLPINKLPAGGYVVKVIGSNKEQYTQQFVK